MLLEFPMDFCQIPRHSAWLPGKANIEMTYVEIWKVATKATHNKINKARHPAAQRRDAQHRDDRLISFF